MPVERLAVILIMTLAAAGSFAAEDAVTNNVVIVLDASGSMNNTMRGTSVRKIDAAKDALMATLEHLPEDTRVGLLVFSAQNIRDDWVYPLGPLDKDALRKAVYRPYPGGKTPLGAYIRKGADRLLAERESRFGYGTYRLLVVTDGEAGDPRNVERYVPEAIARGIVIDVIGVDMKKTHTLATRVNSYRDAGDPAALKQAVADVFAEIGSAGTTDTDGADFDELQGIPDDLATAMLNAVAIDRNMPLGEDPEYTPAVTFHAPKSTPSRKKTISEKKKSAVDRIFGIPVPLIALIVILVFIKTVRNARKRKR